MLLGFWAPDPARLKDGFVPMRWPLLPSSWVPRGASYSGVSTVSGGVSR